MRFIKNFPFLKFNRGFAKRARDGYIWYDFYYGQGLGVYNQIKQPLMVFSALAAISYFELLPGWVLIAFVPTWIIGWYVVGWIWFKVFKIPQRRAIIGGTKISPWEKRNRELLLEILRESK